MILLSAHRGVYQMQLGRGVGVGGVNLNLLDRSNSKSVEKLQKN